MQEIAREARRLEALNEFMRRNPGLDSANAMLRLTINRLTTMLMEQGEGAVSGLSSDKAIGHIIRAAQAQARLAKASESREEDIRKARETVMREVQEALRDNPDLAERLESIVMREATEHETMVCDPGDDGRGTGRMPGADALVHAISPERVLLHHGSTGWREVRRTIYADIASSWCRRCWSCQRYTGR